MTYPLSRDRDGAPLGINWREVVRDLTDPTAYDRGDYKNSAEVDAVIEQVDAR